jgi:hypothetical protein
VAAVNVSDKSLTVSLPVADLGWDDGQIIESMLSHDQFQIEQGVIKLELPAMDGMLVKNF